MSTRLTELVRPQTEIIKGHVVEGLQIAIAEQGSGIIDSALIRVMKMITLAKAENRNDDAMTFEFALLGLMCVIEEVEMATSKN